MDDLILMTSTFEAHLTLARRVFDKHAQANINFNAKKTVFSAKQIKFIGMLIDKDGVRIDERRCDVIRNWPVPKNAKQVKTILGSASYFRKFVRNFSSLVAPLRLLTLPDKQFHWGPEQQASFDKLKEILTSDTVLAYPRFTDLDKYPFIVMCDASKEGFGAVLLQKQPDNTERVIEYQGRATRKFERNASAFALEVSCLVQSLQWFHQFLSLGKFIIRSDHFSLSYIKNLKHSSNSKLLRYAL